jgi:site-specific recombinase XerD
MRPTALATHVTAFLVHYLTAQRNLSPHTIKAYRDVFTLLLRYCRDVQGIPLERLQLEQLDVPLIEAFLDYLEEERHCGPRTRNHRLSALHAFFRYLQAEDPGQIHHCQKVLAIPLRKHAQRNVGYLSKDSLAKILAQPDLTSRAGRRDAVLLSVLYDTGARVQELIDLSTGDVRLDPPEQVRVMGKGRKMRAIPLMHATVQLLRDYMQENGLNGPEAFDTPLFQNRRGERLSRSGVRYILHKYAREARRVQVTPSQSVSAHTFRHTRAMHLLESGVSLDIVRDFLGHVDTRTTQIYAKANTEMKRKALAKASGAAPTPQIPSWHQDKGILEWLRSL